MRLLQLVIYRAAAGCIDGFSSKSEPIATGVDEIYRSSLTNCSQAAAAHAVSSDAGESSKVRCPVLLRL